MKEAISFVGGAALGAVFGVLLEAIVEIKEEAGMFKPLLNEIMSTLESWEPLLKEIEELNRKLVHKGNVTTSLISKMEEGAKLVRKCDKIHPCNIYKKIAYARKFISLKYSLKKLLKDLQLEQVADIREIKLLSRSMHSSISRMEGSGKVYIEMKSSCVVPAPSSFTVGLDVPLTELKLRLFNDGEYVIIVTAPGGCGKTTLASIFCSDHDVQEKFGRNIFFVNISKTPSLIEIAEMICQQMGYKGPPFQNEEEAVKCFFEHLLKQKEQGTLLVFDDAKPGSESLLEKFVLQVPNYKIMVTSRSEIPRFDSTYRLSSLHIKDAMTLFRHSASLENGSYEIPDDLVKKIVERLKEFPLALKVVGRSLRGKRAEIWQRKLKECSKGSSILNSEKELLGCLKSSLDDLGKENLKECFMDLGSFPEDQRIPAVALIDMWTELYENEIEEDALAIANLIDLTNQSLANLVVTRKDVQEVDGYYSEHFVVQHDLLRELAIYESSKDKVGQRKRLIIDVSGDNLSWKEEEQPINARLVSISTADAFSSKWCDMQLPKAEVLVLNLRTKNYGLPEFVGKMEKLKVLVVTNYTFIPAEISSFHLLGFLPNLKRIRLERISIPSLTKTLVQLKNLQKVSLFMCSIGQAFSNCSIQISNVFPNLVEMNIDYCNELAELPAGFCDMVNLKKLSITHCHKLSSLPEDIGKLENLEVLRLRSCIDLIGLPESTCKLSKLNFLDISNCFSLQSLPEHIGELHNLKKLNMKDCSRVQELPPSIFDLEHLMEVICDEDMKDFWESFFPDSSSFINIKLAKEDINLNWLCNLQY